jgi:hypothetical protein
MVRTILYATKVQPEIATKSEACHARNEAWKVEERPQRENRAEPQAGDCHRPFRSAPLRRKGSI